MAEIFKPDDLVTRIADLERRIARQEASGRRGIWHEEYNAPDTISGAAYGFGAPTVTAEPGPTGRLLVGISAFFDWVQPGNIISCSFTLTNGPTTFAGHDSFALRLENGVSNGDEIAGAFTRWISIPVAPGVYYVTWCARIVFGSSVDVFNRALTVIAL